MPSGIVRPITSSDEALNDIFSMIEFFFFLQIIVNKKCQKFDYGPTGNKKLYGQVSVITHLC